MTSRNLLALVGVACAVWFATLTFSGRQVAGQFVPQPVPVSGDSTYAAAPMVGQPVFFPVVNRYQLTVLPGDARREFMVFDTTNGHCWTLDGEGDWHDYGTPPEKHSSTAVALPDETQAPSQQLPPRELPRLDNPPPIQVPPAKQRPR
jgi:hypothetical protein